MELPTDIRVRRLIEQYEDAERRLRVLILAATKRGATGTAAYYQRQLAEVLAILAETQALAIPTATEAVASAYVQGVRFADEALGLSGTFEGVHLDAIKILADNVVNRLGEAAMTVGRQTEDVFRQVALGDVGLGLVAGETREMVSESMRQNLLHEGVTAFRDKAGRRWTLSNYTAMVARTTTREAVSHGTANRLIENGHDLVTITVHTHDSDVCSQYEGRTFSLSGDDLTYSQLDRLPPFHPNCVHVLTPSAVTFEEFEEAVDTAPKDEVSVPGAEKVIA